MAGTGKIVALVKALAPGVDPSVIEQAVTDWLDDHPEATTTVEDGSITDEKLASALAAKIAEIDDKYEKPSGGIPSSDMASAVQTSLGKADAAYQKPGSGIPSTDLAESYIEEPASEGTNGQVLTTDGNGGRTWTTVQGGGGGGASIDDTAGHGDTTVCWSAGKTYDEISTLSEAIARKEPSINVYNPEDPDILVNGYLDYTTGEFVPLSGYFETGFLSGMPNDTFTFASNGSLITANSRQLCFYDKDKNFIGGAQSNLPTLTMSNSAYYVRVAIKTEENVNLMIVRNDATLHEYVPYDPGEPGLEDVKVAVYGEEPERTINEFDKDDPDILSGGKYIDQNGNVQSMANFNESGYVPCVKGDTITLSANGNFVGSSRIVAYYNASKQFVAGYSGVTMPTITVPNNDNIAFIRFPFQNSEKETLIAVKNDTTLHPYVPYIVQGNEGLIKKVDAIEKNEYKWDGKSVVLLGDSITYNDGHNGIVGYPHYLEQLGFATITNKGVNGACVAYHEGRQYESICVTVDSVDFTKYDLVLIAGGINDYNTASATPIGTLENSTTLTDFDKTEFIGALQYILTKILTVNPAIKIALFTPLKKSGWYNANSESKVLKDYADAIKEVAEYYSVPVLDYYSMSGITRANLSTFLSDGLHPNNAGYKFICENKLTTFVDGL